MRRVRMSHRKELLLLAALVPVLGWALLASGPAAAGAPEAGSAPAAKEVHPRKATTEVFWSPAEPLSASYAIEVSIDPNGGVVLGHETIALVNDTSALIERLAIRKGLAASKSFALAIDGEEPRMVPDPSESSSATPILISLPSPLAPGDAVEMEIAFEGRLPEPGLAGARTLLGPPVQSAHWHPRLWWGHASHDDFEVRIHAPEGWALAASGRLDEAHGTYRGEGLRAFGIVLAEHFDTMDAQAGDTVIRCLYRPEEREGAELLVASAIDVIDLYRREFGFYPYPFLSIIPGEERSAGGFPVATGVVAVHGHWQLGEQDEQWWQWITAHEIGHQYWGEYVLDADPVLDPEFASWLSIGLGIYVDRAYVAARGLTRAHHRGRLEAYCEAVRKGADTTVLRPAEQLAEMDQNLLNNTIVHDKGYSIMSAIESVMGADAFRRAHDRCLLEFGGRRLGTDQFQRICEEETEQELDWLFDQWLRTNRYLGYRLSSVETRPVGEGYVSTAVVERFGTLEMPVPVAARFEDGSVQRATTDRLLEMSMLEFTSSSPLKEVVLDPDGALPLLQEPMSGLDVARAVADLPWVGAGESAREVYEQAREGGLDDPDQWFKLGMTLYDGRYYTEALAAFERVADSEDRLWGLLGLVWQGHVLDLLDRREEALARYAEAQKLPWPGPIQHDQYGMVLGPDWLEARLETPFERVDAK